ncbi:hypothetical protein ABPG72_004992 [Tetrahymena utriculariae]
MTFSKQFLQLKSDNNNQNQFFCRLSQNIYQKQIANTNTPKINKMCLRENLSQIFVCFAFVEFEIDFFIPKFNSYFYFSFPSFQKAFQSEIYSYFQFSFIKQQFQNDQLITFKLDLNLNQMKINLLFLLHKLSFILALNIYFIQVRKYFLCILKINFQLDRILSFIFFFLGLKK